MRKIFCLMMLSVIATSAFAAESVDLRYRSYRKWSFQLPAETWFKVGEGIKIAHAGGDLFKATPDGNSLRFDTDGDGELDRAIKPLVDPDTNVSTARVILNGRRKDGSKFRYAARLRKDQAGWEWAPGGAMVGTIKTTEGAIPVRIIDQNGNGKFDDFGADAMIIGNRDEAAFLSKTINVNKQLKAVKLEGARLTMSEFSGKTAQFDMTTAFESKAVLLSAIVQSADKQNSFDVAGLDGPVAVPAGEYRFVAGVVGLGEQRVRIGAGRMKNYKLAVGETRTVKWGGPAKTEFKYARQGGQVQFSPNAIWYYGAHGEQYFNWDPIGKSPEFVIKNSKTGAVLQVAILPGSC